MAHLYLTDLKVVVHVHDTHTPTHMHLSFVVLNVGRMSAPGVSVLFKWFLGATKTRRGGTNRKGKKSGVVHLFIHILIELQHVPRANGLQLWQRHQSLRAQVLNASFNFSVPALETSDRWEIWYLTSFLLNLSAGLWSIDMLSYKVQRYFTLWF